MATAQPAIKQDEKLKREFAAHYKSYRCNESDVPASEHLAAPGAKFRSMHFGDHLVLKLKLGKLIYGTGDRHGGPMRTESRYELYWDGKLVSTAESLFSHQDALSEESLTTTFAYHPATQSLLVFEELEWSTERYIAFEPTGSPAESSNWTVKHFELPARPIYGGSASHRGHLRGFRHGKIYLEMDGLVYAFPVSDFLVKDLAFTVG